MPYVLELSNTERETLSAYLSQSNDDQIREIALDLMQSEPFRGVCVSVPAGVPVRVSADCGLTVPVTIIRDRETLTHLTATTEPTLLSRVAECLEVQMAATPLLEALGTAHTSLSEAALGMGASRSATVSVLRQLRDQITEALESLTDGIESAEGPERESQATPGRQ
jgi:hypothetical protein